MKKLIVTTLFVMLCTVFALGQTSGTNQSNPSSTSQSGTSTSSGSTSSGGQDTMAPSTSQTGNPSTSSGSQDTMGTKSQSTASTKTEGKEKKITGCLQSAGSSGQYTIEHKGKQITVVPSSAVSSEIANHVGHKVKLYGDWEQASASASTGSSSTMAGNTGSNLPQSDQPGAAGGSSTSGKADKSASDKSAKEFRADKVEMVSDSCGGKSKSDTSSNPSTPKPY
jgi:hypothetical protein